MSTTKDTGETDDLLKKAQIEEKNGGKEEENKLLEGVDNEVHKEAASALQEADAIAAKRELEAPMTKWLFVSVFTCAMGSSFQMGYNIGVVNAPQKIVSAWIGESHGRLFGSTLSEAQSVVVWAVTVSIFCIGGMIGGLASGLIADRFGRKGGMMLNNILAFLAAACMGFSKVLDAYPLLILGRLLIGANSGLNSGLAPMYLTELSPPNLRGAIGSAHQLVVTISILISQIFGLEQLFGTAELWPLLFALTAAPAVFQVVALPFCPESPKYNLLNKGLTEQAEKDLRKIRGRQNVVAEMDEMNAEKRRAAAVHKVQFTNMFTDADMRWPLFIAVMMMLSQQLSGINVAMYYSTDIFEKAGLEGQAAIYATLGMGSINVLMTVVSVFLVDKAGRRTLHLTGLAGMWATSIGLVAMLIVAKDHSEARYFCVALLLLFVVAFATGPGSIPWFYVSELFRQGARGHANSVAVMTNWLANFLVGLVFLPLERAVKQYSFLLFTFFLTIFWLFTWKFVPETKGISVDVVVERMKTKRTAR